MVMISPCSGCDTTALARILALFEAISGIVTIIKSAWWYCFFRIPAKKTKAKNTSSVKNTLPVSRIAQNAENQEGERCTLSQKQDPSKDSAATNVDDIEIGPLPLTRSTTPPMTCPTQFEEVTSGDLQEPDFATDYAISETDSNRSFVSDGNANNILWTITGFFMGTINITLGLFLLLGLTSVNYVFILGWCLSVPVFYMLDCILFTFLLKHCTNKNRFDRCRSHYISSTICSFIFNSYVLWVGISVLVWCNCRRDPYRCRFQRDYCFSFNFNESEFGGGIGDKNNKFYDLNEVYYPFETSF